MALHAFPWSLLISAAHPGHGTTDPAELVHYALEPIHAIAFSTVAVGLLALRLLGRKWVRSADRPPR